MEPVEYKSARRARVRKILLDIATNTVTSLLATGLVAVATHLF
ncbi:DUF6408 family protein [Streptomyces sp. NPDC007025]|nr:MULTISPECIES: DUF6408 family protein [unclassified Streptomyces]MDF4252904.1 hypothetical protein [Streptomyces sp. WMMB303]